MNVAQTSRDVTIIASSTSRVRHALCGSSYVDYKITRPWRTDSVFIIVFSAS